MADLIKVEPILNKEDDSLPYGYLHPEHDGKLTWVCGEDQEGKITSIFCMDLGGYKDKKCEYLQDIEAARYIRHELIEAGWIKLKPPEITFTFPGDKEPRTSLNRKQKRYLQRKMKKMQKNNPFTE